MRLTNVFKSKIERKRLNEREKLVDIGVDAVDAIQSNMFSFKQIKSEQVKSTASSHCRFFYTDFFLLRYLL